MYRVVQKNGATLHFPKYLEKKLLKISKWLFAHIKASVCRTWHIHTNFSNSFCSVAPSGEYWTIITNLIMQHQNSNLYILGEWRRRLENVVQCNGGHIEHVCWIEINDACVLDLKSFPVLHFHSCNRPSPICLLSCYVLVIIVQYSPDGATFLFCLSRLVTHTPAPQIRPSIIGAI